MRINSLELFSRHRRTIVLAVLASVMCGALAGVVRMWSGRTGGAAGEGALPEVEVVKVERKDVTIEIELLGTVSCRDKASVSSRVPGRIDAVYAEQGDRVAKGQLLALIELLPLELEHKSASAELKSAEAAHRLAREKQERAEREVEKHLRAIGRARVELAGKLAEWKNADSVLRKKEELFRAGGVSQVELDALRTGWTGAQAKYLASKKEHEILLVGFRGEDIVKAGLEVPADERARAETLTRLNTRLEAAETDAAFNAMKRAETAVEIIGTHINEAYIRAPIDGVVAARTVEKGERVKDDAPLFVIMNVAETFIIASAGEKETARLRKGQEARFTVDAVEGTRFRGEVYLVSPVLDTGSRTVEVRILAENADGALRPGMFARAAVSAERVEGALVVSRDALGEIRNGASEAFLYREGALRRMAVKTGREFGAAVEVLSGLEEGDLVAGPGMRHYADGMKVRIAQGG
jgi:HlyD family secretion protein